MAKSLYLVKFTGNWKETYKFFSNSKKRGHFVICEYCNSDFKFGNGWEYDAFKHITTLKHKDSTSTAKRKVMHSTLASERKNNNLKILKRFKNLKNLKIQTTNAKIFFAVFG